MDSMETQPMDEIMSPIARMAAVSLNSPQPEKVTAPETQSGDKNDFQEESAEEEEMTSDEEVEMLPKIAIHSDLCIDIISEEESILSPQKARPADLRAEGAGSDSNCGGEPRVNAASTKGTPVEASVKDCVSKDPFSVEEIMDSDDGEETKRGVFKVGPCGGQGNFKQTFMNQSSESYQIPHIVSQTLCLSIRSNHAYITYIMNIIIN